MSVYLNASLRASSHTRVRTICCSSSSSYSSNVSLNEDVTTTPSPPSSGAVVSSSSSSSSHANTRRKSSLSSKGKIFMFLAGGIAGTVVSALTIPIEVMKTQFQSSTRTNQSLFMAAGHIFRSGGIGAFYRGLVPTLIAIIPTRIIFLGGYAFVKSKAMQQTSLTDKSPLLHFIAAFFANIVSSFASNPIWMIRTRMQLFISSGKNPYSTCREAILQIWRNEGAGGFMKGLLASYWGVSESCINWMLYENMKATMMRKAKLKSEDNLPDSGCVSETLSENIPLPATYVPSQCAWNLMRCVAQAMNRLKFSVASRVDSLPLNWKICLAAGVSKLVSSTLTYPHEVLRTRIREEAVGGEYKYTGMLQALQLILLEEGIEGLYAGMGLHLLRTVPNNAILLTSYEIINRWVENRFKEGIFGEVEKKQQHNYDTNTSKIENCENSDL